MITLPQLSSSEYTELIVYRNNYFSKLNTLLLNNESDALKLIKRHYKAHSFFNH